PRALTLGIDGSLWFTEEFANQIGRLAADGTITEFAVPTAQSHPRSIVATPDGRVWFTEFIGNQIGSVGLDGEVTEIGGLSDASHPIDLAIGADGNLWFTEGTGNRIGRLTPATAAACVGDCNGDQAVTIDELLKMINV